MEEFFAGTARSEAEDMPGGRLEEGRMPGHWLLARLGKRVLRPGGRSLTRQMLGAPDIGSADSVVEFAPGLGVTARLALQRCPRSYTGVERDEGAAGAAAGSSGQGCLG